MIIPSNVLPSLNKSLEMDMINRKAEIGDPLRSKITSISYFLPITELVHCPKR
jgi:hypothetical protein